jgi:predicted nucleic acid-binding protein
MPERVVICNTSPLLYLYQIHRLDLLQQLYRQIIVPTAVEKELLTGKVKGINVPDLAKISWLETRAVADRTLLPIVIDLGAGEAEVIALGLIYPDSLLLMDDQLGRRIAALNKLTFTGTLGILIKARQAGYLSSVTAAVTDFKQTNMRLSAELITLILTEAGEI